MPIQRRRIARCGKGPGRTEVFVLYLANQAPVCENCSVSEVTVKWLIECDSQALFILEEMTDVRCARYPSLNCATQLNPVEQGISDCARVSATIEFGSLVSSLPSDC